MEVLLLEKLNICGLRCVDDVAPRKRKLRAVIDFFVPTDVHKVRSFLRLANYFGRFIKYFARVSRLASDPYYKTVLNLNGLPNKQRLLRR